MTALRLILRPVLLALLACAALLARAPRTTAAGGEVLRDEWQVVSLAGSRIGYVHTVVRRLTDPPRIESTNESRMVLGRLESTVETTSVETTVEREDGTLLSVHAREKQSAVESVTEIVFEAGKARMTTETMGQKREAVVDVSADLVGPWKAERMPVDAGFPAGKTFDVMMFMRQLGGPRMVHMKVVGPEDAELPSGEKASLVRLEQTFEAVPMKVSMWVQRDGVVVKTRMTMAGMVIESRRSTKAEALAPDDGKTPPPDAFLKTLITSKVLVPHARTLDSALIRVRPRSPEAKLPDLTTERQTLERTEPDGALVLRIHRAVPPDGAATRPLADPKPDVAPFLAPSSALQSDDPLIVKAAQDAVGAETDAWKAAQSIERWVAKNLTKKNMGVGFASALEVCKNREGDCTEHAVLVAALCRATGIPARVVMGLEYLAGIWGGHAWSEVLIAGRWYALDATNGYGFVDALHIAVAASALAEGSFGQELTALVGIVGSVDIEVLETTWNGRTFSVGDPAAIQVAGPRYVNRLCDLAFTAPEGFAVQAVVPAGLEDRLAQVIGTTAAGVVMKITVRVEDLPPEGPQRPSGTTEIVVDGRTGFAEARASGDQVVHVASNGLLFRFRVTPGDEAGQKVLQTLLASVDFDPPGPVPAHDR